MARAKAKDEMSGQAENGEGGDIEERKRVLRHASSLNRADVIKKVVHRSPQAQVRETPVFSVPIYQALVSQASSILRCMCSVFRSTVVVCCARSHGKCVPQHVFERICYSTCPSHPHQIFRGKSQGTLSDSFTM